MHSLIEAVLYISALATPISMIVIIDSAYLYILLSYEYCLLTEIREQYIALNNIWTLSEKQLMIYVCVCVCNDV